MSGGPYPYFLAFFGLNDDWKSMRIPIICLALSFGISGAQEAWTLRHSPASTSVSAMAGMPGLYLVGTNEEGAVADTRKYFRSTNGVNWGTASLPYAQIMTVGAGEILGGGWGIIWRTVDGLSFTIVHEIKGGFQTPAVTGIAYGQNCVVAVTSNGRIVRAESSAGPWEEQLSPSPYYDGLAFGNGIFMTAYSDEVITSSDGSSWISTHSSFSPTVTSFSDGVFYSEDIFTRNNGLGWLYAPRPFLAAGAGWFVAVDENTGAFAVSRVATFNWSVKSTGFSDYPKTAAFCGDLWLAASQSGKISTSPVSGAPPLLAPPVTVKPALELTWPSISGRVYQVKGSADNINWTDSGFPIRGDGGNLKFTAPANDGRKFFRVEVR